MTGHIGTEIRPRLLREAAYWAMGASLTQQRRVKEEGFRVVNFFDRGRAEDGTLKTSHG